jgi:hypothetical protein
MSFGGNSPTTGGAPAIGGANATGGARASGGVSSTAPASATGGSAAGGTKPNTGTTAGGAVATGGAASTSSKAQGGASTSGGSKHTGNTQTGGTAAGGAKSTGGTLANGGTKSVGGTLATAGTPATGGAGAGGSTGTCAGITANGHYQMENIDRGVVAVKVTNGVYVGWRMMGYEYDAANPTNIAYNVYRDDAKVATVTNSTNYLDSSGTTSSKYSVSAVVAGAECARSAAVTPWAQNYLTIPLTPPATGPNGGTYSASDGSTGDLDGDGKYDIVLKWDPSNAQDNSNDGVTDDVYLDGYTLAGTRLWRIDLGANIRAGAHYTQFVVYDFDGDGKAEVACKTAPGTKDGTGAYLSTGPAANDDDSQVYRNSSGYILTGPEYLTVFSGATGKELATIDYPVLRGTVKNWGDDYGNRVDRFNAGVAYVKENGTATGKPAIIMQRGYYTRLTVSALTWRGGALTKLWTYDSGNSGGAAGQGDHSAMAADTDNDGAQEIITGASTIGGDGKLMCTTGLGHGDALHVGELVPGKGISVFTVHEGEGGYDVHNGATCATIVKVTGGDDNGRGVADDIDPDSPGAEMWSATSPDLFSCETGKSLGSKPGPTNFLIYWDGDESRELEDGTTISKYGGGNLLSASGCASNNGTKSTPTLTADLLGDWREEIVWRQSDNKALRVYTTTTTTTRRIYTLMHDPTYRAQVSFEQSSYNQPPHTGFHIGSGMANPPPPGEGPHVLLVDSVSCGAGGFVCVGAEYQVQTWEQRDALPLLEASVVHREVARSCSGRFCGGLRHALKPECLCGSIRQRSLAKPSFQFSNAHGC